MNSNQTVDLDVSDLFSSSDDDDSDLSDNESDNNTNKNTTQKHIPISPKYESCRVIISNLNHTVKSSHLADLCAKYGNIKDIYVPMDRNNNTKNRGFGYVTFDTKEQSMKAISNINGTILYDKVLRAGYAKPDQRTQKTPKHQQNSIRSYNEINNDSLDVECDVMTEFDHKQNKKLMETTVNISGLSSNVKIHQIQRMFNGIGKCLSVYLYEYDQFETKFINAVVRLDLKSFSFYNSDDKLIVDVLQPMPTETFVSENKTKEENIKNKEGSDKKLNIQTKRRQKHVQNTVKTQTETVQETVLSVNLDERLNKQ